MQPLAILFGAVFTVAVAFSCGALLLRDSSADPAIRFVSGSAILSALIFTAGLLHAVYPAAFLLLGTGAILAAREQWRFSKPPRSTRWSLLFIPYFVLYFFNSMAPEISYDGSRYHLALVSRYLREHGIHPIFDSLYAAFPQGVEMLYLFAFAFGRHSAAAMVHVAFLLALVWQIYAWSRWKGFPLVGIWAALLVFTSPAVGVDGSSAYNDVAVAAIVFTLFHVLELWSASRSRRLLVAAGLLAGFACAAKYTAFPAIPYAIGVVWWQARRVRPAAVVAGLAGIVIAPWMLKNYFWYRNPTAPFFNHWFDNSFVTASFESEYRHNFLLYGLHDRWEIPMQLTTHGSLAGLLGPVFLLAPLALLALRSAVGRRLLLAAAVFGATYFSNISTRFLIPVLPFAAIAMCLVMARIPRVALAVVTIHAVISWPPVVRRYCRADAWHLVKIPYREALRIKPEEGFLESNLPYYGITRLIDRMTPPGSTIFTSAPIPDAYTARRILVHYQSAANIVSRRVWFTGFVPEHAPALRLRYTFAARPIRAFRLLQKNTGAATWTVHEVRAFDGGRELARTGWVGAAQPYPWGIDAATDGRLVSFWMCGDTLRPGQFMRFDLTETARVDTVELRTALDQPESAAALDGMDERGGWVRLSDAPLLEEVAPPSDLRRQAAAELKRRGIDYLLTFDGEFGAEDLRTRADAWGIEQVTEYKGARLYRLP